VIGVIAMRIAEVARFSESQIARDHLLKR